MQLINQTGFSRLLFYNEDVDTSEYAILIHRATFDITSKGLSLCADQVSVRMTDVWSGEPALSSYLLESDLAPYRPSGNLVFRGNLLSNQPRLWWNVSVKASEASLAMKVHAPRFWQKTLSGSLKLESGGPVTQVEIGSSLAYGGYAEIEGTRYWSRHNPGGHGYWPPDQPVDVDRIAAPQLEFPNDPLNKFGDLGPDFGFSPLLRSHPDRLKQAGSFDEDWLKSRWPHLPLQFNFAFYDHAPTPLRQTRFFSPGEGVIVHGVRDDETVNFELPRFHLAC